MKYEILRRNTEHINKFEFRTVLEIKLSGVRGLSPDKLWKLFENKAKELEIEGANPLLDTASIKDSTIAYRKKYWLVEISFMSDYQSP